ncbi:hypothetical protein MTO96_019809 [Rhipicephalus appendiculatus]
MRAGGQWERVWRRAPAPPAGATFRRLRGRRESRRRRSTPSTPCLCFRGVADEPLRSSPSASRFLGKRGGGCSSPPAGCGAFPVARRALFLHVVSGSVRVRLFAMDLEEEDEVTVPFACTRTT